MTQLRGPADVLVPLTLPDGTVLAASDAPSYRALAEAKLLRRKKRLEPRGDVLFAYVNDNRWIADCPRCGAGIAVHPEWAFAGCLGCGAAFAHVAAPAHWPEIESVLLARPPRNRHWHVGETLDQLRAENRQHLGEGG